MKSVLFGSGGSRRIHGKMSYNAAVPPAIIGNDYFKSNGAFPNRKIMLNNSPIRKADALIEIAAPRYSLLM